MTPIAPFYRGRIAPSPTGLLHLGHARTFWIAAQRTAQRQGTLILRNEDLDPQRCRPQFVRAMIEDLRWLGIEWTEGPDCGGAFAPYSQSERRAYHLDAWRKLHHGGWIYPCTCSRKDVAQSASAPNDVDDEPVYPGTCRPNDAPAGVRPARQPLRLRSGQAWAAVPIGAEPKGANWRFRVPEGEEVRFTDLHYGAQSAVAGRDFGDFILWRRDAVPAYHLAVVVDDAAMQITEVVRGADLLKSTARHVLLYRALGLEVPAYYHCDLVRDESGMRLAKRHDSLSIRRLRERGWTPEQVREDHDLPPG